MKTIYAIRDRVANDLVTMQMYALFTFKADQQAIRYFADAILEQSSMLAKHPGDFELISCGTVEEDGTISPLAEHTRIVLTGDALIAAQQPKEA